MKRSGKIKVWQHGFPKFYIITANLSWFHLKVKSHSPGTDFLRCWGCGWPRNPVAYACVVIIFPLCVPDDIFAQRLVTMQWAKQWRKLQWFDRASSLRTLKLINFFLNRRSFLCRLYWWLNTISTVLSFWAFVTSCSLFHLANSVKHFSSVQFHLCAGVVLLTECYDWSVAAHFRLLAPFRRECCTGGESVAVLRVNRSLEASH